MALRVVSADGLRTILPQGKSDRIWQRQGFALRPEAQERRRPQRSLGLGDVPLRDGTVVVWLTSADPDPFGSRRPEQPGSLLWVRAGSGDHGEVLQTAGK